MRGIISQKTNIILHTNEQCTVLHYRVFAYRFMHAIVYGLSAVLHLIALVSYCPIKIQITQPAEYSPATRCHPPTFLLMAKDRRDFKLVISDSIVQGSAGG